ncbi:MAG TPA: DDE-type integrase/transposase/recombinase [Bryobacteraceae bacterium]|nr:DDE-type integrase/transposase/recombinase [Bryobacteraceae bacterium]
MTCHNCRTECKRHGRDRKGNQRFQCRQCSKTFLEPQEKPLDGMYLPLDKAEMVLRLLLEGNSVSSVERLTEVHHTTILKLLVLAGEKCERIMAQKIRNVEVRDVECDEVWAFIGKKQKRVKPQDDQNLGDAYTFVAIERHSKLVLNIAMGKRDQATTDVFIEGLRHATSASNFQITTDGFGPYRSAISNTLEDRCDFAQLIKVYRAAVEGEARYSPAEVSAVEIVPVMGRPDRERICTSIVERSNLSLRMGIRRFTRLTNGFSKKWENHWAAVTLWFTFYNFCRVHKTLRCTPAMEAGISDHIWSVRELLERHEVTKN